MLKSDSRRKRSRMHESRGSQGWLVLSEVELLLVEVIIVVLVVMFDVWVVVT